MKLNIGCGYDYLAGHVNIDNGADSLADKKMDACLLDFGDASAGEIKASQLIEHLGFFKTKYFLAECRRALEPGGLLVLETPLIEKTFELFLRGGRTEKEAALGWIYGSESAGMGHLYCFPEELLKELAAEAGFGLREAAHFEYQPSRPALRLTLEKAADERADFLAAFRRALTLRNAVLYGDEYALAEQEKLIRACAAPAIFSDNEKAFELALYQPDMAAAFFSVRGRRGGEAEAFLKASESLAAAGFPALMYRALMARPLEEKQRAAFDAALDEGRVRLKQALESPGIFSERAEAPGGTPKPVKTGEAAEYPAVFSFELARLRSQKAYRAGLKAGALLRFPEAAALFKEALSFYRDDPAIWLRFGRTLTSLGESGASLAAYKKAQELFRGAGASGSAQAEALDKEITSSLRRRNS